MTRSYVVVDVETNGLNVDTHQAVEVAWWNVTTGLRGEFVPQHSVSEVLAAASIEALRVNRYVDRLADAVQDSGGEAQRLYAELDGATLVGSNPRFDASMLRKLFAGAEPWHYRLLDIGAYGAGVLGLPPEEGVPGLWQLTQLLGISLLPGAAHTAWGDVSATGEVLQALWARAAATREGGQP